MTFISCFGCSGLVKIGEVSCLERGGLEVFFPVLKLERSISHTVPPHPALSVTPSTSCSARGRVPTELVLSSLGSGSSVFGRKSPVPAFLCWLLLNSRGERAPFFPALGDCRLGEDGGVLDSEMGDECGVLPSLLITAKALALDGLLVLVWFWGDGNFRGCALDGLFNLPPHGNKDRFNGGDFLVFSSTGNGALVLSLGERDLERGDFEVLSGVVLTFERGDVAFFGREDLSEGETSSFSCSLRCFFSLSLRRNLGTGFFGFLPALEDEKSISHAKPSWSTAVVSSGKSSHFSDCVHATSSQALRDDMFLPRVLISVHLAGTKFSECRWFSSSHDKQSTVAGVMNLSSRNPAPTCITDSSDDPQGKTPGSLLAGSGSLASIEALHCKLPDESTCTPASPKLPSQQGGSLSSSALAVVYSISIVDDECMQVAAARARNPITLHHTTDIFLFTSNRAPAPPTNLNLGQSD